jgi:dipeptidyl aminopeptidase/acylaminoacyl peptidase
MNLRNPLLDSLFLAVCLSSAIVLHAQPPTIEPTDNLVTDGIPAIPAEVAEQVRRYTESRAASFVDWHPTRREMLISTRFGNTPQLHYLKMPGGARTQITFFNEPVGSATFDPIDGEYFVFGKDVGGNEFSQLYRFDLGTGLSTLLTDGKRSQNGGAVWNRAKDQFVYASTQRNGADRDLWKMNPLDPNSNKLLIELSGGGWQASDWSPDNSKIALIEMLSVNKSNIWMLDVASGKKTQLTTDEGQVAYSGAEFSHDGKGLYITSDKDNEFQRLAYMDMDSGKVQYLTSDIAWDVSGFELSPDGKTIGFLTNEAGISKAYLMDTATKKYRAVQGLPTGVIGSTKWHENSRDIAFTINSARSTSDVYSLDAQTNEIARWTESELGGLLAKDLVEPDLIRWKSFDGLEISGFLYRAPDKFTGKRPVIINIHGGPEGQSQPIFQGRNNFYLNELGVSIIYPNVRGSTGYGKTFVAMDNALKRLDSVKDIGALLDWIATQPDLDSERVMVTGGSYGGYMTLAAATTYNDRIRCSLDVVGISHFATFLKNTESYRRDLRRVEYGDERIPEIAAFFEEMAPLNNASKITKPLFVVQGGNDPRVPLTEAEQMVSKVKSNKSPVWYLMAKDEGHGFRKKNNADFQFYATTLFVRQYLLGEK